MSNEALPLLGMAEHLDSLTTCSPSLDSNAKLTSNAQTLYFTVEDTPAIVPIDCWCSGAQETRGGLAAQLAQSLEPIAMSALNPATKTVRSLYRRSLKLALDWAVQRNLWRGQAVYIRSLFDANKNIRDPRQQRVLFTETEKLLQKWKHPDPYIPPTAPGGSKYERNVPAPDLPPPPREQVRNL